MKIYVNEFVVFDLIENNQIMEVIWNDNSVDLTEEEMVKVLQLEVGYISQYNLTGILSNSLNFKFIMKPELQQWVGKNILPKYYENGLRKLGFLVPKDIFAQISIEQSTSNSENTGLETKHFDSREKVLKWLLS